MSIRNNQIQTLFRISEMDSTTHAQSRSLRDILRTRRVGAFLCDRVSCSRGPLSVSLEALTSSLKLFRRRQRRSAARRPERLWSTVAIDCRRLCCARSVSVCAFSAVLNDCRLCRVDGGAVYDESAVRTTTLSRAYDCQKLNLDALSDRFEMRTKGLCALRLFLKSDACLENLTHPDL